MKAKVKLLSHVRLFAIPRTAAYQAPPSMGFSKREYWSGVPLPSPVFVARMVQFSIVATSSMWPFKFIKIKKKLKPVFKSHSYLSSAQQPGVASSADGLKNLHH